MDFDRDRIKYRVKMITLAGGVDEIVNLIISEKKATLRSAADEILETKGRCKQRQFHECHDLDCQMVLSLGKKS